MKLRLAIFGVTLAACIGGLGLLLASVRPLDHGIVFLAVIVGFVLCDRSFWPKKFR